MDLRSGKSFEESTKVLMRDYDAFTECMSRETKCEEGHQQGQTHFLV